MKILIIIYLTLFLQSNLLGKERIAIIDTGLQKKYVDTSYLCPSGHIGQIFTENRHHGTNIFNLITKDLDKSKYCIIMVSIEMSKNSFIMNNYINNISKLNNIQFINMSLSGDVPDDEEKEIMRKWLDSGIIIFVAAGNNSVDLAVNPKYPASYAFPHDNFFVVGSHGKYSNYGHIVDLITDGDKKGKHFKLTGTSQSTAILLNRFLKSRK